MAFDIEEFKAYIEDGGVLQNNKYDVQIVFPAGSPMGRSFLSSATTQGASSSQITDDMMFRCINASLPGIALRTTDVNRFGVGVLEKMPFSGNYTDMDLTFLSDRYGDQYSFLYGWINNVFSVTGQVAGSSAGGSVVSNINGNRKFYTTEYKDNYSATIIITVYDNGGDPVLVYTLYKAFPIAINDIPVSWADRDGLLKVTTKITFREWSLDDFGTTLETSQNVQSNLGIVNTPNTFG